MTEAAQTLASSPWKTQAEAAEYAKCGVRTINEALRKGELVGHQSKPGGRTETGRPRRGGTWRIHIEDLDAWIRGEDAPAAPDVPRIDRARRGRRS